MGKSAFQLQGRAGDFSGPRRFCLRGQLEGIRERVILPPLPPMPPLGEDQWQALLHLGSLETLDTER